MTTKEKIKQGVADRQTILDMIKIRELIKLQKSLCICKNRKCEHCKRSAHHVHEMAHAVHNLI